MEEIKNPGQEASEAETILTTEAEAILVVEGTEEVSVETEAASVQTEEAPAETEAAPVETKEAPAETEEASVQAEEASVQTEAAAEAETVRMPEPEAAPEEPKRIEVVDVRFRNNVKNYYFDPNGLTLKAGDHVIIETARGDEYGLCAAGNHSVPAGDVVAPLRKVHRIATAQDEKVNADNQAKEKRAFDVCMKKIEDHKLDMQLVSAECAFDGSKILFFFTAEGRVDFRELVKDLASVFRTRIELRQIGVRDKAKMVGGLGVCGRPFCCKEFLDDFQPVSIKMAKTQNLSLNPTKISGTCGRLMCCLKYEQEAYEDLLKTAPKNESFVDTPDGRGTVTEVNLLRQCVKVRMEEHPETIGTYPNTDIYVIRNGKARKNDPPIPKDLAPISSKPRPRRKPVEEDAFEALPELIFNSDKVDPVAPGEPEAASAEQPAEKTGAPRRRRRRGCKKPNGEGAANEARPEGGERKPQPERKPQEKRPAEPRPEGEGAPGKPRRRRRPRGNRPKDGQSAPPKAE